MKAEEAKRIAISNRENLSYFQLKSIRERIEESVKCGRLYCVIDDLGELHGITQDTLKSDGYKIDRDGQCWSKAVYFIKWE